MSLSPVRTTLPNGVTVIARETRKTPAATINIAVRAGSIGDPPEQPGATYLLSRVIDRGTATRSADDIAAELDDRGISLTIAVTRHLMSFVCTCLADDVAPVLAMLADIIIAPSIPDGELATRKGEVVTLLRQDEDNPAVRAVEAFMALLYGESHPYGRRQKGSLASVEQLTRADLLALHRRRFAPGQVSVVVVGDVPTARVSEIAADAFGSWTAAAAPDVPLPAPPGSSPRRVITIPMMNKAQTDIAYGFTTIARSDPSYYAFWLMNNVLGQYALGGRLGDSIRERQGMAYYVSSTFDPNVIQGPLLVRAGVSAANVDRAIDSIDQEIAVLSRDGITERELNESRQYLIGSLPRALETNAGIAQFLQTTEFFNLGLDYDVRLPELLRGVTREQVHRVAQQWLDPARATVVIAGPYTR